MDTTDKYNIGDTIAAIGTKPGGAAISIVRISGKRAIKIADKIFRAKNKKSVKEMQTYTLLYGYIVDKKGTTLDQVILSLMRKPGSYTREDIVEINCHGGLVATNKVLDICLENGARIAQPGEFTRRAFLNGRIDLSQAEAVIEIINARTEESLKIAAKNIKGEIGKRIKQLRNSILDVLIELEASIDFIEEDLEITPYEDLKKIVLRILDNIKCLIEDEKRGEIIRNGIKVAIIGKPNVGKSSLLNALAKKEKAIVTHIPGTTRDSVEEVLYMEGMPWVLIDTAGIRKAKNVIEKLGVERSIEHINSSDIIIMVIDHSKQVDLLDLDIIDKIKNKKFIMCINKIDLKGQVTKEQIMKLVSCKNVLEISAKEGTGLNELEEKIKENTVWDEKFNVEDRIIINARQKKILLNVKMLLENAIKAMSLKMSEEFPSSDLKIAYDMMGEIIGETTNEEIINGIFSKFCIGK